MTAVQYTEQLIAAGGLVPVVVLQDAADAAPLAEALLAGGLRCVEVTFRTDAAAGAIAALARYPELLVGAGTVLNVAQAGQALDAGARFVVSPGFGPAVVRHCLDAGVPVVPGAATATEIQMALDAGLDLVKFFPAEQSGGAAMVKALSAPFRGVRFVPTGGVTLDNLAQYLALPSVLAVGGTWMVAPELIAQRDWAQVTARTAAAIEVVHRIRPELKEH